MTPGHEVTLVGAEPAIASFFDALPPMRGAWPEGQPKRKKSAERRGFDRRGFIKRAVGTGMSLGLASLTVFPPARAFASDPYDIKPDCPPYAADHGCSSTGGCGPSTIRQAACTSGGWHDNTACFYRWRPNECYGGWADGWYWRPTGCQECGSARTSFRCHDGWTCPTHCGRDCSRTICRAFMGCS